MKRYDLVEYGGYYRDHQMDPSDDGEWVRFEEVEPIIAGLNKSSMLNAAILKDCRWSIDDVGGDSVYETQCGHSFYFDDSSSADENGFRFCGYCGGRLVEVKTSDGEVAAATD